MSNNPREVGQKSGKESEGIIRNETLHPSNFRIHLVFVHHVGNTIPSQLLQAFKGCYVFIPKALTRGVHDETMLQHISNSPSPLPPAPVRFHFVRKLGEMIAGSGKIVKLIDPIGGVNPFDAYNKEANNLVNTLATAGKLTSLGVETLMRKFDTAVATLGRTQNVREEGMAENLVSVLDQLQTPRRDTEKKPLHIAIM